MKRLNGFSLMEMMVVLTIVAIVAAASAPMVNKKMVRAAGDGSPWQWAAGGGTSIGYNFDEEGRETKTASIGVLRAPEAVSNARLYIDTQSDATPHIAFGRNRSNIFKLIAGGDNNNLWLSNENIPNNNTNNSVVLGNNALAYSSASVAIGRGAQAKMGSQNCVVIGSGASASNHTQVVIGNGASSPSVRAVAIGSDVTVGPSGEESVAIGANSSVQSGSCSIAVGRYASTRSAGSIALGSRSSASGENSIAIGGCPTNTGNGASASGIGAISIGQGASATASRSVAIGQGASATTPNTIVLGTATDIVRIPGNIEITNLTLRGNLVVEGDTLLGGNKGSKTYLREDGTNNCWRITRFRDTYSKVDRQGNRGSITAFDMARDLGGVTLNGKKYTDAGSVSTGKNEEDIDNETTAASSAQIKELEQKNKELEAKIAVLSSKIDYLAKNMKCWSDSDRIMFYALFRNK